MNNFKGLTSIPMLLMMAATLLVAGCGSDNKAAAGGGGATLEPAGRVVFPKPVGREYALFFSGLHQMSQRQAAFES